MFGMVALAAVGDPRLRQSVLTWRPTLPVTVPWLATAFALAVIIGGRVEVGGDWFSYERNLHMLRGLPLAAALTGGDPGYQLLSWLTLHFGGDKYLLNTLAASVFVIGLISFCRAMPQPALALAVAIPYLVIVVAMGYTRQSMALGLAMLGLLALQRGRVTWFIVWVMLGAAFHKSAVLLLPIAALASAKSRIWAAVWAIGGTALGYNLLLEDAVDQLLTNYVQAQYQSSGALIRLAMNALPALILLRWRFNFFPYRSERKLWTWIAIISLCLFALFFLSPSSTAVDRVALYILPIQLAVLSRVPAVFGGANGKVEFWTVMVLLYCAAVQFVWLNFAAHSQFWLPYRFYPLELLMQSATTR